MFVTSAAELLFRESRKLRRFLRRRGQAFPAPIRGPGLWASLRRYPDWKRSLAHGNPLDDRRPWITYGAIDFLDKLVVAGTRCFEWGCGGSTAFLLDRGGVVTSIEHDPQWYERLKARLASGKVQSDLRLIPAADACEASGDPSDAQQYFSSDPRHGAQSFRDYVSAIDEESDDGLDLVLIDGRARPACIRHARRKVRPGGWLVLDNADRAHYQPAIRSLLNGWRRRDFAGPIPYVEHFVCTSAWQKEPR